MIYGRHCVKDLSVLDAPRGIEAGEHFRDVRFRNDLRGLRLDVFSMHFKNLVMAKVTLEKSAPCCVAGTGLATGGIYYPKSRIIQWRLIGKWIQSWDSAVVLVVKPRAL